MEKKAVIFMDFQGTFDKVYGNPILCNALRRFFNHFDGDVDIAVISSADPNVDSIRPRLAAAIYDFPEDIAEKFKYLIEGGGSWISTIYTARQDVEFSAPRRLSQYLAAEKSDGVESFLEIFDDDEITTCVFAGDNPYSDVGMMKARVGEREKVMLYVNNEILKAPHFPVYSVSMELKGSEFNFGKDIISTVGQENLNNLIIQTCPGGRGLTKGFEVVNSLLEEKERQI